MPYNPNRQRNSTEADKASGQWNSASTSIGDDAYMRGLTNASVNRDQEKMRSDADAMAAAMNLQGAKLPPTKLKTGR